MARRLTLLILLAMLMGILVGFGLHRSITDPAALVTITDALSILSDLFLRLIKMIIAPLVFATLVGGVVHMGGDGGPALKGGGSALGRIGLRAIGWFLAASLVSLTLGLILVDLFRPGIGLGLPLPPVTASNGLAAPAFNLHDFLTHIVPASAIEAMAKNDILPIVVFSVFFGVALAAIGERGRPIVAGVDALAQVMLRITDYVMRAAPFAVFGAVASAVAKQGLGVLMTLGTFMASFYGALLSLWILLFLAATVAIGRRARDLFRLLREPFFVAFSTASSEAAFPRTLEALERFGVPPRIAGFVLPLGYSFNLDGSMIYCSFATMFIAQAYGINITFGQQLLMLLMLMVTSKGIAGIPRASLVVIAATLPSFHLPEAGLLLILAVDHFLDMGRSATNVIGNAVASVLVARWEKVLGPASEAPGDGAPGPIA